MAEMAKVNLRMARGFAYKHLSCLVSRASKDIDVTVLYALSRDHIKCLLLNSEITMCVEWLRSVKESNES